MVTRNNQIVPLISPVPHNISRPFWSVMIPTYNCANFLVETLKSVLIQDPGVAEMQVEVVDDCSTKDDPEAVVREIGQGRVSFFRKPQNGGAIANFNTCIERAQGQWVHILHGDDSVLPGFYSQLREGIEKNSQIGAAITRCIYVDDNGNWRILSHLERDTPGIIPQFWQTLFLMNQIMTPCIVVKRSVYEHLGGFNTELIHAADWEMWRRISVHYPFWFEPLPLACYREHSGSHTTYLIRTGSNIIDIRKSIDTVESYLPPSIGTELSYHSRKMHAYLAFDRAIHAINRGDTYEAVCQIQAGFKCDNSPQVRSKFVSLLSSSDNLLRLTAYLFGAADFDSADTIQLLIDIENQQIKA